MFDVQVRVLTGGRSVAADVFVDALALHVAKVVRGEIQNLSQVWSAIGEHSWRERPETVTCPSSHSRKCQ